MKKMWSLENIFTAPPIVILKAKQSLSLVSLSHDCSRALLSHALDPHSCFGGAYTFVNHV